MAVIAIANQKGGTAKTTTAVNLGACLAHAGRKVVLVDLDAQCNLTTHLGLDPPASESATSYGLLSELAPESGGGPKSEPGPEFRTEPLRRGPDPESAPHP